MTDFRRENISSQKAYDLLRDWIKLVARHTNPDQDISGLLGWLWKLKPQTPDPATGLMPCGCGGKPKLDEWDDNGKHLSVTCPDCTIQIVTIGDEMTEECRQVTRSLWNRAMGLHDA